jgi:hypothetical protein
MHWLGIYCPVSNSVNEYDMQLCNAYLFTKEVRQGIQTVWLTYFWSIWKEKKEYSLIKGYQSMYYLIR